jgi:hypothetical protein
VRYILLIGLVLFQFSKSHAGTGEVDINNRPLNRLYLNVLGDATLSFNYERLYFLRKDLFVCGSIGAGLGIPHINYPTKLIFGYGGPRNFLEFGIGGSNIGVSENDNGSINTKFVVYPILGYRLQPIKTYRVGFGIYTTANLAGQAKTFGNGHREPVTGLLGITVGFCF